MIKCGMLLDEANLDNIQGASYDLVLGDEYFQNGEIDYLTDEKPFIVMKPGDYVIVSSKEIANMPRDIAGRFDISVSLFCKGVILSNGPQIDPGFRGRLFCLLFNTSCEPVQLKLGDHFATIEFIKLIEPAPTYAGGYQDKLKMKDYLPKIVEASAINKLLRDVENLKKEAWLVKLPIIIAILALIVSIAQWIIPIFRQNSPAVNFILTMIS
jgi:deoxycytidine triphosphate deaminase